MIYTAINIVYDTDGENLDLPESIKIDVPTDKLEGDYEISEYISDEISNVTGFCHKGFDTTPKLEE